METKPKVESPSVLPSESLDTKIILKDERTKDNEYWLQGDFVVFQVEKTLFRVPTFQFIKHSEFFAGIFAPKAQQQDTERDVYMSWNVENPLVLPNSVTVDEFKIFLRVIYPLYVCLFLHKQHNFTRHPPTGINSVIRSPYNSVRLCLLSIKDFTSVLKLSTMWKFLDYRQSVIARMSPLLSSAEKIKVGREYTVYEFVHGGFEDMISRDEVIGEGDARLIGPYTALALSRLRETWKVCNRKRLHNRTTTLEDLIKSEGSLSKELKEIELEERKYRKVITVA